jgi:hypothetical protein
VSGVVAYRAGRPYGDLNDQDPRVSRVYDPATGKLTMVAYAADGSLRLDHWCYMDGERLLTPIVCITPVTLCFPLDTARLGSKMAACRAW